MVGLLLLVFGFVLSFLVLVPQPSTVYSQEVEMTVQSLERRYLSLESSVFRGGNQLRVGVTSRSMAAKIYFLRNGTLDRYLAGADPGDLSLATVTGSGRTAFPADSVGAIVVENLSSQEVSVKVLIEVVRLQLAYALLSPLALVAALAGFMLLMKSLREWMQK